MSVQFETRPVRGSRGPNPAALLAVGLAAFVAIAIVKPWEASNGGAPPHAVPAPSAEPSAGPAGASGEPAAAGGAAADIDWTAEFTAVLRRRGSEIARSVSVGWQLGLRAITAGGRVSGTAIPTARLYGSMLEWWYPAAGGRRSSWSSPPIAVVQPSGRAGVLALGVTSGAGDHAIDVRFWRLTATTVDRLAPIEVTGPNEQNRLFLPPAALAPRGGWPDGRYVAEVLLGTGVVAIPFRIGEGSGPPLPRTAIVPRSPGPRQIATALSPGAFVVDGFGGVTVEPAAPGDPLDAVSAWLALGDPVTDRPPRVARFRQASPAAVGVTLPAGAVLESASLTAIAPVAGAVDALVLQSPGGSMLPFVAFTPAHAPRWNAGTYRITARFREAANRAVERSWHLDLGADAEPRVPRLLAGAARWMGEAGDWAVLSSVGSAGTNRIVGETLASAREPEDVAMHPERLGSMCPGSAHVDRASPLIGVAFPPHAGVTAMRLVRRYAGGASSPIDVPSTLLPAAGLALFGAPPETHGTWAEGYYDIEIAFSPGLPRYLPLCIGRDAGSTYLFRVDPASSGTSAAGAFPGGRTMLSP